MDVAIDQIKPSPYQPRLLFDLDDLKEEIQRDGLLSALVVRKKDEYYELLDGERRLRVLKELGRKTVPVDVRDVDDVTAKRSVFKLNLVRQNYTTEEKARYFKKLADEGTSFYQIGKELNIDDNWVLAHLNVFKFREDLQKAVWANAKGASIAHIQDLEPIIGANLDEAAEILREDIERGLTREEARKALRPHLEEVEKARVEAAQKALSQKLGVRTPIQLETPEDYEKAAEALRKEAQRQREEAMTPEEKAAQEAERKAKAEAQAAAKAQREEERRQEKAREKQEREERATKRAEKQLIEDPNRLKKALRAAPKELIEEIVFTPEEREILGKPSKPTTTMDKFYELEKLANKLSDGLSELQEFPSFGKALLGIALQSLRQRIDESLERMGIQAIEGEVKRIEDE